MKFRPAFFVIIICLLGIVASSVFYLTSQRRAGQAFTAEIDAAGLQRLIERQESFLVYFYGRSCDVCVKTEPYFVQALQQAKDDGLWRRDILVYKCERDANATVRSLYGVEHTPMYSYFFQGIQIYGLIAYEDDTAERFRLSLAGMMLAHEQWEANNGER